MDHESLFLGLRAVLEERNTARQTLEWFKENIAQELQGRGLSQDAGQARAKELVSMAIAVGRARWTDDRQYSGAEARPDQAHAEEQKKLYDALEELNGFFVPLHIIITRTFDKKGSAVLRPHHQLDFGGGVACPEIYLVQDRGTDFYGNGIVFGSRAAFFSGLCMHILIRHELAGLSTTDQSIDNITQHELQHFFDNVVCRDSDELASTLAEIAFSRFGAMTRAAVLAEMKENALLGIAFIPSSEPGKKPYEEALLAMFEMGLAAGLAPFTLRSIGNGYCENGLIRLMANARKMLEQIYVKITGLTYSQIIEPFARMTGTPQHERNVHKA